MTELFAELELSAAQVAESIANSTMYAFKIDAGQTCLNLFRQIRDYINSDENFGIELPKKFKDAVALELFKILR